MTEDQKEKLGQLIDSLDNLAHALQIPMPPQMHVDALRSALPGKVEEFKAIYQEIAGENPWE